MNKVLLMAMMIFFFSIADTFAGTIQYLGTGRPAEQMKITYSRDKGSSWKTVYIKMGQTLSIPPDATHLNINNVPCDPKRNYKIKDGNVF